MYARSRALSVEMVMVMLVLIVFALVVFSLISAGTTAYGGILDSKESTQSARVAYSYINMKLKQNDTVGCINVEETEFGNTLVICSEDGEYITYLFCSEGALYECVTAQGMQPSVAAGNRITALKDFALERQGAYISITCVCESGDSLLTVEGIVGLRS
jgi:hypothetical protein